MFLAYLLIQAAAPVVPPAPDPVDPGKELHDSIVSAIRNCRKESEDEIAVCSKDRGFAERYRIEKLQKPLQPPANFQVQLASPDTGASGTGSCTATGAGGSTGCSARDYRNWGDWKRQQKADGDYPR